MEQKKEPKIEKKLDYDERRKHLISTIIVETDVKKTTTIQEYKGENIKKMYSDLMVQKKNIKNVIQGNEIEIEKIDSEIKALELKPLTQEEEKLKNAVNKINSHLRNEELSENKKGFEDNIIGTKKSLKDINLFIEQFKSKVKNVKLE